LKIILCKNGVHFADYISHVDVPGSSLAFKLRGSRSVFRVIPDKSEVIDRIELIRGRTIQRPVVMAVTLETGGVN